MSGGGWPHQGEQDREGGIRALPGPVGRQTQALRGKRRQEVNTHTLTHTFTHTNTHTHFSIY